MTNKKWFVNLFKYIPPIAVLILTVHIGLLLLGIVSPITELLVDSSVLGGAMMVISSIMFKMCLLHKISIWYTCLGVACIDFQKLIGFGILLIPLRWIMFTCGFILIILLIGKYVKGHSDKCFREDCF